MTARRAFVKKKTEKKRKRLIFARLEKLREAVAHVEGRALREVLAALGVRVVVEFGEIAVSTRLSSCIDLSSTAAR